MLFPFQKLSIWTRVCSKLFPARESVIEEHIKSTLTRVSAEAYETRRPRVKRHLIYFWILSKMTVIGSLIALVFFYTIHWIKVEILSYLEVNRPDFFTTIESGFDNFGGWIYWGDSLIINLLYLSEFFLWFSVITYLFISFYKHYVEYKSDYIVPHSKGIVVFYRISYFSIGQKAFEFNFLNELTEETSFWGNVFNYGTLKISKTGNSAPYEFKYCKNIHDKWKQIKELQDSFSGSTKDTEEELDEEVHEITETTLIKEKEQIAPVITQEPIIQATPQQEITHTQQQIPEHTAQHIASTQQQTPTSEQQTPQQHIDAQYLQQVAAAQQAHAEQTQQHNIDLQNQQAQAVQQQQQQQQQQPLQVAPVVQQEQPIVTTINTPVSTHNTDQIPVKQEVKKEAPHRGGTLSLKDIKGFVNEGMKRLFD